jgi:hypothetical protein
MFNFAKAFTYLSLLGVVSQSLATSNVRRQAGADDIPNDAKSLSKDCQDSIYAAGVTAAFKASKAFTGEYLTTFKLSASLKDVTDLLASSAFKSIKPIQRYTKEYDIGFSAKLNYEQVCALDKDGRVSAVVVCERDRCSPENDLGPPVPPPALNSNIKGAPNIAGLSPVCARVVWYTVTEFDPATVDPGKYVAETKVWVTQKDSDAFFLKMPGIIRNPSAEADGFYAGKWTNAQLCEVEKSPLVYHVETMSKPPPKGAGGKGKGTGPPPKGGKGKGAMI